MLELIIERAQDILAVPTVLINSCTKVPLYIREALISSINFIPWLYFIYYGIELLERFFLKNIHIFIKLVKRLGPLFGAPLSVIPECGYQVVASTLYSRKMITRGTLLAFFISCSDDALPIMLIDFDIKNALVIIPIILIKLVVAVIIGFLVDIIFFKEAQAIKETNAINTDINIPGCCHHRITTQIYPPFWWTHPLTHTFNMFMFTFLSLCFINCVIQGFGGVEKLANYLMIDSYYQVIGGAIFGLIPNCVTSIFLALLFVKGIISLPTLVAGLVTTTGLGLLTLTTLKPKSWDVKFITFILLLVGIVTGLLVFYNLEFLGELQKLITQ